MIYKFVIAGIVIQCESEFPLVISEYDSGFLSSSDKNPDFCVTFTKEAFQEPACQKLLFRVEDLIVTEDAHGQEVRYFQYPDSGVIYGSAAFVDDCHIKAVLYDSAVDALGTGIPFWNFFLLDQIIYRKGGLILHASYICQEGKAILFSAPSGVGKSTQADLWKRYRGSRIVNGDRALLMQGPDGWIAHGFPFHGSSEYCLNESYPIRGIIVLRQGKMNQVVQLSVKETYSSLMTELICNSWNRVCVLDTMSAVERLLGQVPVCRYTCNMEESAVDVLEEYLHQNL